MSESKQSMEQLIEKYKQELVQYGMKTPSGGQVPVEKPIETKTISLTPLPFEQREETAETQQPEQGSIENVQEAQEAPCAESAKEAALQTEDETEAVQVTADAPGAAENEEDEGRVITVSKEPEEEAVLPVFEPIEEEKTVENINTMPEEASQTEDGVVEIAPRQTHIPKQETRQESRIVQPEAMRMRKFPPDVIKLALDKNSPPQVPQAQKPFQRAQPWESMTHNPYAPPANQSGGVEKYGWTPGRPPQPVMSGQEEQKKAVQQPEMQKEAVLERTEIQKEAVPEDKPVEETVQQQTEHCIAESPPQIVGEQKAYTGSGALKVQVFAAQGVYPVSGARVAVFRAHNGRNLLLYDNVSDDNGFVQGVILPAPSVEDTGERALGERPFASYSVFIEHPGYLRAVFRNIAVYDGVESIKPVFLIPQSTGMKQPPPIEF